MAAQPDLESDALVASDVKNETRAPVKKVDRVKRPEKPDRTQLDAQVEQLQTQIDQCQSRIQQIKALIEQKKDSRRHVGSEGSGPRSRLAELRQTFKVNVEAKNSLRALLAQSDAARDRLREEAKQMRDKLSFVKVEQIDDEIAKLENKISHTTMEISEERRAVEQIKQLRKSRDLVKVYNERLDRLHDDDSHRRMLLDQIKAKDNEINQCKLQENAHRQMLEAIRQKEAAELADIPSLANERNEAYEVVREAREAMRTLRAEFKAREDTYYQQERLWRNQTREDRQKQWEAVQAERKERDARRKAWELENAPDPFEKEVHAAEQLLSFFSKFEEETPSAVQDESPAVEAPTELDGMQAMRSRKQDLEPMDAMFMGVGGGKKGKGKNKGEGGKSKKAAKREVKEEALSFSLDAFGWFALLKMQPPLNKTEAIETLAVLKEKKNNFLERRRIVLEKKAKGETVTAEEEGMEEPSKIQETEQEAAASAEDASDEVLQDADITPGDVPADVEAEVLPADLELDVIPVDVQSEVVAESTPDEPEVVAADVEAEVLAETTSEEPKISESTSEEPEEVAQTPPDEPAVVAQTTSTEPEEVAQTPPDEPEVVAQTTSDEPEVPTEAASVEPVVVPETPPEKAEESAATTSRAPETVGDDAPEEIVQEAPAVINKPAPQPTAQPESQVEPAATPDSSKCTEETKTEKSKQALKNAKKKAKRAEKIKVSFTVEGEHIAVSF